MLAFGWLNVPRFKPITFRLHTNFYWINLLLCIMLYGARKDDGAASTKSHIKVFAVIFTFTFRAERTELIKWRQWQNNDADTRLCRCSEQTFNYYHYIHQCHVLFWTLICYNGSSRTQPNGDEKEEEQKIKTDSKKIVEQNLWINNGL